MVPFHRLSGHSKRRHMRLVRRVFSKGWVWVRGESTFRMVERLHKAGLIEARISKWNLFGVGCRPFRELVLTAPGKAPSGYPKLPR